MAACIVAIVAMMVVPLPTVLLDLLIAANVTVAVALLLVSLYVPNALRISTFPAILLLTTLFRLALNVSSTRLILLQADAGRVIDAFGQIVVQGNYVVGAVVFAILTIVQFVVIARGAERVAEVAARFTLDAMPGRQMAIDSDLRANLITGDQARRMRAALQEESQLFGAMDGAMKFVKGDAIAGVVIIAVNVAAGMLIGVLQLGMSGTEALETYTILSIGDGLASQIPALLIATAAGMIVTRVAAVDDEPLGSQIIREVTRYPRALGGAAVLLALVAAAPGMPVIPFLAAALVLVVVARTSVHRDAPDPGSDRDASIHVPPLTLLEIHVSEAVGREIDEQGERFHAGVRELRQALALELGVAVPTPRLRMRDYGPRHHKLCIDEVPVAEGALRDGEGVEELLGWCHRVLSRHAGRFVDLEAVQQRLDDAARTTPALVANTIPGAVTLQGLTDVLRELVSEDVSVRNLPRILGLIAEQGPGPHDRLSLVDAVREGLAHDIVQRYLGVDRRLRFFEVDRSLEDMVLGSVRLSGRRSYLALGPKLSQELVEGIADQTRTVRDKGGRAILVTDQPVRWHLRSLIRHELPDVVVLARQELVEGIARERSGWITA